VAKDTSMNGNLFVSSNVGIGKAPSSYALDVSGIINCTGIVVGSAGETDNSGMTIMAMLTANGGLTVPSSSTTTLASTNTLSGATTISGTATLTNGLTVTKNATFNDRLLVSNDVSFNANTYISNIYVNGTTSFPINAIDSSAIYNNNRFMDITSTQYISGDKWFNGNMYLTSEPSFNSNVIAPGNVFTGSSLVATTSYVGQAISYLVGTAPAILDTLAEIAQSLSGDASAVYHLTNAINLKVDRSGDNITGNLSVGNVSVPNQNHYTFDVSGTTRISQTLFVVGNVSIDANLSVIGDITSSAGNVNITQGNLNLSKGNHINQF
jgi:hypothetical protein